MSWLDISTLIPAESINHYNISVKRRRNIENGAMLQKLTNLQVISELVDDLLNCDSIRINKLCTIYVQSAVFHYATTNELYVAEFIPSPSTIHA